MVKNIFRFEDQDIGHTLTTMPSLWPFFEADALYRGHPGIHEVQMRTLFNVYEGDISIPLYEIWSKDNPDWGAKRSCYLAHWDFGGNNFLLFLSEVSSPKIEDKIREELTRKGCGEAFRTNDFDEVDIDEPYKMLVKNYASDLVIRLGNFDLNTLPLKFKPNINKEDIVCIDDVYFEKALGIEPLTKQFINNQSMSRVISFYFLMNQDQLEEFFQRGMFKEE